MKQVRNNKQGVDNDIKLFKQQLARQKELRSNLYKQYEGIATIDAPSYYEYDANDLGSNLGDSGYNVEESPAWYKSAWQGVSDTVGGIASDLANSARMWTGKFVDLFIGEDQANLRDASLEQEDLQKILEYKGLHSRLRQLQTSPQYDKLGFRISPERVLEEINDIENKIKEYDDYFMGEGRSHTVIAQQMFDVNKMDALDKMYVNAAYIGKNFDRTNYLDGTVKGFFNQLGTDALNILSGAGGVVDWIMKSGAQGIDNLFGRGDKVNGYKTGEVIKSLDANDRDDRAFLNKLYKGSQFNVQDIKSSIDDNKIKSWQEENDRRIKELTAELKRDLQFAKDGKLFGIDIYDPEDIPQQFKQAQEKFGENWYDAFIHPYDAFVYGLPETASTVGMMSAQIGAMGTNGFLNYIAKEAPVWAIGGGGRVAGKILPELLRKGVGKAALSGPGSFAMLATGTLAGIDAAVKSRKKETALEAFDAVCDRVAKDIMGSTQDGVVKFPADMEKVSSAVTEAAQKMGIDTSDFEIDDIVKFAIAYNVNTGDGVFEKAKIDARKGLNKLINSNNALAVVDYMQALPFMSYSGSAMKSWAGDIADRFAGNANKFKIFSPIAEQNKSIFQAVNDATIGKIADKFIKEGASKKGLFIKHAGEWGLKAATIGVGEKVSEGVEEINQSLLQQKYKRGLYDDYKIDPGMLDLHEVFSNANLTFEGLAAYCGITPWDPELNVNEIRKSFFAGTAGAALFSLLGSGISNTMSSTPGSLRDLVQQLKNDKYVSNIVSNYYNLVLDLKHLELFFDAFTKAGVDRSHLQRALSDLRDAVDENNTLVKKDYVNSDIQLMNAAWSLYNNKELNDALKANGIEKYSDLHKQLVVDGAAAIVESQKTQEQILEDDRKIREIQQNHVDVVRELLDEDATKERIQQIELEFPELSNIVLGLRLDYLEYKANREQSKRGKFGSFVRKFDSVTKFLQNEGVKDYIIKHGLSEETVQNEEDENYNPLEDEAKRIFANDRERKAALRYAYEYENRKNYNELLQDEPEFSKNKYIRKYARGLVTSERDLDSKVRELYLNKEERQKAISAAYDAYDNGTYSLEDYAIERIHLLHLHQRLQRLQYARDIAVDKHRRNMEIRKRTGLDTYTGLEGIIKSLEKEIEYYKKVENGQLNKANTPQNQRLTWADLFRDKDYKFDDLQDYDQTFSTLVLNKAINGPQRVLAAAYMMGRANPIYLHDAIFGETEENNELSDIKSQYNQILAEEQASITEESDVTSLGKRAALSKDKKELEKKAAWKIIKKRLDEKIERRKIANRIFEEEGPITPATVEAAQNESESQLVEPAETSESSVETTQVLSEAPMSDAERRLNTIYNHERGNQRTLQERVEEHRRRRQSAVVEDEHEEPEEEELVEEGGEQESPSTSTRNLSSGAIEGEYEEPEEVAELENEDDTLVEGEGEPEGSQETEGSEGEENLEESEPEDNLDDEEPVEESLEDVELEFLNAEAAAEEVGDRARDEAIVLDGGWVLIEDYSELEFNDEGFLTYDGEILPPDQQQSVLDDLALLSLTEQIGFDQEELPDGTDNLGQDNKIFKTNSQIVDLISQTFFYQPNPKKVESTGEDEIPNLTVNDRAVKFDKPVASGRELSKKLSQPGWLASTKKYFIVTLSQQGKNVARDKDIRDAMTVALVIEDNEHCYLSFLRPLGLTESEGYGEHGSIFVDSEKARRNWLLSRNVDWRKVLDTIEGDFRYSDGTIYKRGKRYPLTSSEKVKLYQQAVSKIAIDRARLQYYANTGTYDGFEHWWSSDPIRSDFRDDESWSKAVAERKRVRKIIFDRARLALAHPGKRMLSEEEVDTQINNLRAFRNQIIDAYLTKETKNGRVVYKFPNEIKKTVTPAKVSQSNGKVSSRRDNAGNPIFRTIANPNASVEDIELDLQSGDILLGYGLGLFANENDRFAIKGLLDGDRNTTYNGKGLSGKIYMMVKGPAGSEKRLPVMLSEERFDTQVREVDGKQNTVWLNNPNNLVLCLKKNPQTGEFENVNTKGYKPSAAEIIFYMLINQMNVGLDAERHAEMVEFFIHSGEKTLLKNQPKSGNDPFNVLGKKQLAFHLVDDIPTLSIGMLNENGRYVLQEYTVDEMMAQTEDGENLRRSIVQAIATQMHWNTDLSHMNSSINVLGTSNSSVAQLFRWSIDKFAKDFEDVNDYLDQRVSIFGCPQLSFRIGDFFDKKGDDITPKTEVSMLAWMIKEGKIMTDTDETVFTAPFIFANGVEVAGGQLESNVSVLSEEATGDSSSLVINITTPKLTRPATKTFDLSNQAVYDEMVSQWRPGLEERRKREGWFVAKTEEERLKVRDSINETKDAKDNGGINDRIMIRSPKEKISAKDAVQEAKKVIKNFLDEYNKAYPDNAVNLDNVGINELTEDLIKQQWALKKGYILLDLYKNGKAKVLVRRDADFGNWRNPVTGVFSKTIGGSKTLDFDKAKSWLSKTLGIDENNIVLTKAVMRSATNESVFGLTNVALDRIAGEVVGYMKFSEYANSGIEYHEAWHYVNLLMHDEKTRNRIYESYLKTHKSLNKNGVKIKEVEEAMADDFKVFMEGFVDNSITGKIKRLFNNILDFLIASRRKSAYRTVFKNIASGKYAGEKLNQKSVDEFLKRYSQGVASVSHSIPGLSKRELEQMTNVRKYQDILDGTSAVINRVFSVLDLTSPKKMQEIATNGFGKVLQIVDDMIGEQSDENKILKLQDIRRSENFLRNALINAFLEMGIVAKVKKATDVRQTERTEINEDAFKKEESPENTWDKFTLSSQRKENASLRTKMFLRQIPIYDKQYLDDGTVQYLHRRDDYGTIKMYDPDQAWRTILDTLWSCDSYSDRTEDGKYSPTSLLGIVENHKNINPFFYSLFEKLQDLDLSGEYGDIQLKSLIFSTINSSKTQVQLIKIQNPKEQKDSYEDELYLDMTDDTEPVEDTGSVADKKRQWIIQNDSLISIARNLPRKWSKNLASNGLLGFNATKNESVVDRNFAKNIESDLNAIQKTITKYTSVKKKGFVPKPSDKVLAVLDELKPKIIEFYNKLGIECDLQSLNVYISLISEVVDELTPQQQIDTLNKIFNTSKVGSIPYVIEGIVENIGLSSVTHSGSRYDRAIDEAFSEYLADSQIGVLALAWSSVHPSSQEFSVKDANGNRLYPINQNNYLTDRVRAMNNKSSGYIKKMLKSPYCQHSIIADAANLVDPKNQKTKIKLSTFVGVRDADVARGADYFGITAAEDYIAKLCMTEDDQIIFPTMADKKTWNTLFSSNIKLTHDVMLISPPMNLIRPHIYEEYEKIVPYDSTKYTSIYSWQYQALNWYSKLDVDDEVKLRIIQNAAFDSKIKNGSSSVNFDLDVEKGRIQARFSDTTLNRFAGYFLDELNTLIAYYDKEVIKKVVKNSNRRIENYHGRVKDGRMDFSGNGGKFRYLYDIPFPGMTHNLNHTLEGLFELQKKIEASKAKDASKAPGDIHPYIGTEVLGEGELDGFELVRKYLKDLKKTYFKRGGLAKPELLSAINKKLIDQTELELYRISRPGSPIQLAEYNSFRQAYIPKGIPEHLLDKYAKVLQESGYGRFVSSYESKDLLPHVLFSLIGSHVVNTATSIIEVEKIFSGDPAFYKKKTQKGSDKKSKIIATMSFENGQVANEEVEVENLDDVFSDKIKRLGGTLSPGLELRLDFNEDELAFDETLNCSKYTNLNVEDIEIPSLFLDEIETEFKRQLLIDAIRNDSIKGFQDYLSELQTIRKKNNDRLKEQGKKTLGKVSLEDAIDKINSDNAQFEKMLGMLTKKERDKIESELKLQMRPYKNITVADALVFIRPALYRKIRISLGEWSTEPDETGYSDEEAYNIIEGITVNEDGSRTKSEDPSSDWTKDPKLYEKVKKLLLYPLKMSYFQNDTEEITKDISINRPIYNKMAIFPLFAFQRSTRVGSALYARMNKVGNELDMISFKSAVKVGAVQSGANVLKKDASVEDALKDLNEQLELNSDCHLDYSTGEVVPSASNNLLAVTIQDLHNLRLQLNTHAHDAELRAIGTQMFKIAFSNIIDDAWYGTGKAGRKARRGSNIKKDIVACINALTRIGVDDIKERFYKNGHIDDAEVESFIKTVIRNNGLGTAAEQIVANGGVAAGTVSRTVFENSASAIVNSDVVDINTKGGTAIQLSVFGFVGYGNDNVATLSYNSSKELKWSASEGSMQVMLSMNFFKAVIPNYNNLTHDQRRDWLVEHNIIGDDSKPFGVGYRIPTQGMSSMFAFLVADVLPETVGDLIIVPREFTAQTGSDFDVDKLFLATMSYKDGVLETLSNDAFANRGRSYEESLDVAESRLLMTGNNTDDIDVTEWLLKTLDVMTEDIRGAISNRLLLNYIDIISDKRNYSDARGSIDVITNLLHDQLLDPVLKVKTPGYITGMTELLPSFQALRKMEFGVGKDGIGPFALNITNLAQTQFAHLTIDFGSIGEEYGFRPIDRISGRDGRRISAWLSAMVNAHVDVAKDPYVFDLNVNQATYNHANLLLRAGMGLSTFTFLAQPILKDYAGTLNNIGGLYGDNLDGTTPMSEQNRSRTRSIYKRKLNYYKKILSSIKKKYEGSISDSYLEKAQQAIKYFEYLTMSPKERRESGYTDKDKPTPPLSRSEMFNEESGKKAIKNFKIGSEVTEDNVEGVIDSLIYQLSALLAFQEIDQFALMLSQLVQCSQIDTKKFGNTIHSLIDFVNKYDAFRLNSSGFTINEPGFEESIVPKDPKKGVTAKEKSTEALNRYFNKLYLNLKLRRATYYTKDILSRQLFSATDVYESIFKNILGIINGIDERVDVDGTENIGYKTVYNKDSVDAFADGLDTIMRFNSFMTSGPAIYLKEISKNDETNMIDFTIGGDMQAVVNKFKQLIYGDKENKSIFVRTAKFISKLKKDPYADFADDLVDADGNIINDLLLYLNPQTPNEKYPIGRMLLQNSQTENKSFEELRLISAFAQLLSHDNEEVRHLAYDLAFYAYFSTYDQNTANSFFHLVPSEYRKQYDSALKYSLLRLSSKDTKVRNKAIVGVGGIKFKESKEMSDVEMQAASNIIDVLSRNYWYDDNIVPVHFTTSSPAENQFQSDPGSEIEEFMGPSIYDANSGRMFPTYIASTPFRVKNSSMYIKLRKGSGTVLYKRVGVVNRSYEDKKGNVRNANPYFIYIAVPKAGMHVNKIKQFELYCDYTTPSIFEENRLEKDYAEDIVRADIESMVEAQNGGRYELKLEWDNETVPEMYKSSNSLTYVQDPVQSSEKRRVAGVTVYVKKDPENNGQKNATVILDVVNVKTTGEVDRPNIRKDYMDKVVEFPLNGDIEEVVKNIKKIQDTGVKIHLTTPLYDGSFDISNDLVEQYIQQELNTYRSEITEDALDVDLMMKTKEESLRNSKWTKTNAILNVLDQRLHELTQRLILSGVTIARYSSAAYDGKTQLARSVSYIKQIDGSYFESDKNAIFVHDELSKKKKKFMRLLSQLDQSQITQMEDEEANNSEQTALVENVIEQNKPSSTVVSKFAVGDAQQLENVPEVVKDAEEREQNNEESKNEQCGGRNRKLGASDMLLIDE